MLDKWFVSRRVLNSFSYIRGPVIMHRHFVLITRERKWDCMQLSKRGSDAALRSCVSHMYLAACVAALSSMTPGTSRAAEPGQASRASDRFEGCPPLLQLRMPPMMPPRAGPPLSWPWLPVLMLWDKMTPTCTCNGSGRYARAGHEIGTRLFHTAATDLFEKHDAPDVFM